ncbi:MAG: galactokinase, partial [Ferruginibacter sp.]
GGFNCVLGGDIPRGSGMSSSAAVEGGLAFALNEIFNCGLEKKEQALLCQRAEHNFPAVQCGIMDQYANMFGKKDQVILLDCKNITHEYFPLKIDGYKIILINSKVHHSLAAGEYNVRRQQCETGLAFLKANMNISSFRDIQSWEELIAFKNSMDETVYNRCLFVVQEIKRTQHAAIFLKENNLIEFGQLMYGSHEGLSKLYEVSCKELDFLADFAKQNENVIGSRMMGGGFGGCTINIVKEDSVDDFIEKITAAYQKEFSVNAEAYSVASSNGVEKLL